jgi:hypothetical protein
MDSGMMKTNNVASDEDASSRSPLTNPSTRHDSSAVDTGTKVSGLEATAAPYLPIPRRKFVSH